MEERERGKDDKARIRGETHEGLGSVDLSLSSLLDGISRSELVLERRKLVLESSLGLLRRRNTRKKVSGGEMTRNCDANSNETHLVGLVGLSGTSSVLSSTLSLVLDLGDSSLVVSALSLLGSGDSGVLSLALELLLRRVDLSLSLLRLLSDLSSGSSVS